MPRPTGTKSIADLLAAGLLQPGEQVILRRQSKPPIEGTIEPDGRIRVGRTVYNSPSTAARKALNVKAVDGWLRWRVPRLDDRNLAEIRDEA